MNEQRGFVCKALNTLPGLVFLLVGLAYLLRFALMPQNTHLSEVISDKAWLAFFFHGSSTIVYLLVAHLHRDNPEMLSSSTFMKVGLWVASVISGIVAFFVR